MCKILGGVNFSKEENKCWKSDSILQGTKKNASLRLKKHIDQLVAIKILGGLKSAKKKSLTLH